MNWIYTIEQSNAFTPEIQGIRLKIVKKLIDESGAEVVTSETTALDAYENAPETFLTEYLDTARAAYISSINQIFDYLEVNRYSSPTIANSISMSLNRDIVAIGQLKNGTDVL